MEAIQLADPAQFAQLKEKFSKDDMGTCFANLYMKIDHDVSMIKSEMKAINDRTVHLEKFANEAEAAIREINQERIPEVKKSVTAEENERLKLEIWGRKWNLVVRGIKGPNNEKGRDSLVKVIDFFANTLKAPEELMRNIQFQACHRLPGGPDGKRNIIVRFTNLLDRDDILDLAMKLPPKSGFSVVSDLPRSVAERRATLLRKRNSMPPNERQRSRLIYLKEFPFVDLKTKPN